MFLVQAKVKNYEYNAEAVIKQFLRCKGRRLVKIHTFLQEKKFVEESVYKS